MVDKLVKKNTYFGYFFILTTIAVCAFLIMFSCDPNAVRTKLNKMPGVLNENLERRVIANVPGRDGRLYNNKIFYGDDPSLDWSSCESDLYWNEQGMVILS